MKNLIIGKTIVLFVFLFFSFLNSDAVTRTSVSSGNWADGGTWNPAGVPSCGDSVIILATHAIGISSQQNYTGCLEPIKIIVYGRLQFHNGSKLSLPCGSYVIVYVGGAIEHDQGYSSSNLVNICGNVEWNSDYNLAGLACLPASHPVCSQVLPVELAKFETIHASYEKVELGWQTFSETNSDYFSVERSDNGFHWSTISEIPAAGNSNNILNYHFTDKFPLAGTSYYRLVSYDLNGDKYISKTLMASVVMQSGINLLVAPNPASDRILISVDQYEEAYIRFEIYDISGKLLFQNVYENNSTIYELNSIENLPKGALLLKVFSQTDLLIGASMLIKN